MREEEEIFQANCDIVTAEAMQFHKRWEKKVALVPLRFINWYIIMDAIRNDAPETLGPWNSPAKESSELEHALGVLSHIMSEFVEFVNYDRKANVLQYVNTYYSVGHLDLALGPAGEDIYVITDKAKEELTEEQIETMFTILEARDTFLNE